MSASLIASTGGAASAAGAQVSGAGFETDAVVFALPDAFFFRVFFCGGDGFFPASIAEFSGLAVLVVFFAVSLLAIFFRAGFRGLAGVFFFADAFFVDVFFADTFGFVFEQGFEVLTPVGAGVVASIFDGF